ncbi:MAG: YeiH family protein [Woeseiaceae bacterium]
MSSGAKSLSVITALMPGIALAGCVAFIAYVAQSWLGYSVMLYALLLGMPLYRIGARERFNPGIVFSAKKILRFGVALLGLRLTLGDVVSLGLPTLALVIAGITLTMTVGVMIARSLGLKSDFAVLCAGAVAICGASAALAVSAVLPQHEASERQTILTVIGVTALSTVAMVAYPPLASWLGFDDITAGVFVGATIHDVAQVVGAGYTISDAAGQTATLVKLMRVACLIPVVAVIAYVFRRQTAGEGKTPALPFFLIGFVLLMLLNSTGLIPAPVVAALSQLSGFCLVLAVAALGIKTSLGGLVSVGVGPIIAITLQTILLALFAALVLMA